MAACTAPADDGMTPLRYAAGVAGSVELVRAILAAAPSVDVAYGCATGIFMSFFDLSSFSADQGLALCDSIDFAAPCYQCVTRTRAHTTIASA